MSETYPFVEERLAKALGLPQRLLQKARAKKLAANVHFDLVEGKVHYAKTGVQLMVTTLYADWKQLDHIPDLIDLLEKSRAPGQTGEINGLIHRTFPNPRIVDVTLPDARIVRLPVRTAKNLRPGMVLRLRRIPGNTAPAGYELAQRLPRTLREGRKGRHAN